MFTGIVQDIITIIELTARADNLRVTVTLPKNVQYQAGDSILLNGICSTIESITNSALTVEFMPQTRTVTTVDNWQVGQLLNCEAPLTLQTKISGSLVTGHIDAVGQVIALEQSTSGTRLTIALVELLSAAIVPQGSITIDGVNLTIASIIQPNQVIVYIIPHTFEHTTIQQYTAGTSINIEFDYIAKLVQSRFP
ncbi:MAG: hypothetical protein ACD_43C00270G0004 [uncultured bacterium]|nr:MAG: hypothetical protein ACD_43C00270G0004 [uncultured bacterium]